MPIKIFNPTTQRKAKVLVFSPPGHGKTRFLGTAVDDPRTYPMILLDYEGGTSTLVGKDIDIVRIHSMSDYEEVYRWLKSGNHKYKSIGLDSVSETHINALLTQLDESTRRRALPDLLEMGDYGIALVQMRRLLRRFRDLPYHFFATAAAKEDTDSREGVVKKPALAGALADEAPGIFEAVVYLALSEDAEGETQRVLVLRNVPKIRSKIRLPEGVDCPDVMEDPTVTKLLDLLQIADIGDEVVEEGPKEEIAQEVEEEEVPEPIVKKSVKVTLKAPKEEKPVKEPKVEAPADEAPFEEDEPEEVTEEEPTAKKRVATRSTKIVTR